jgi:hypothetical protein
MEGARFKLPLLLLKERVGRDIFTHERPRLDPCLVPSKSLKMLPKQLLIRLNRITGSSVKQKAESRSGDPSASCCGFLC